MKKLKCLDCGTDIEVDNTIDVDNKESYVVMFNVGHCPHCEANYQWNEYFEFNRFGNLERS